MHGMHARTPRNFVLEERLERYGRVIELDPVHWAGRWAEACWPSVGGPAKDAFARVELDLGCGKGAFLVEAAQKNPQTLYIGMDAEPLCIAYTAQHIVEAGLGNAIVAPGLGSAVAEVFGPGELACIHLNFPTPYPRKKEASKRLTALERLLEYRAVLAEDATLCLRTDSQPLRDFTLTQLELAGYTVRHLSEDDRADYPDEPISEYEQRLVAQGARVLSIRAIPDRVPNKNGQAVSLSLFDYLPDDLFAGGYIPYGMEGAIVNLRNREARRR